MNERDLGNLQFLMNLRKSDMRNWIETVTKDDLDYAVALLETAALDEFDAENQNLDVSEAKAILYKYTLLGKSQK